MKTRKTEGLVTVIFGMRRIVDWMKRKEGKRERRHKRGEREREKRKAEEKTKQEGR